MQPSRCICHYRAQSWQSVSRCKDSMAHGRYIGGCGRCVNRQDGDQTIELCRTRDLERLGSDQGTRSDEDAVD